jgi:hypothetical protein
VFVLCGKSVAIREIEKSEAIRERKRKRERGICTMPQQLRENKGQTVNNSFSLVLIEGSS